MASVGRGSKWLVRRRRRLFAEQKDVTQPLVENKWTLDWDAEQKAIKAKEAELAAQRAAFGPSDQFVKRANKRVKPTLIQVYVRPSRPN